MRRALGLTCLAVQVRIEDFPIMPVESVGFALKPFGFFTGNTILANKQCLCSAGQELTR